LTLAEARRYALPLLIKRVLRATLPEPILVWMRRRRLELALGLMPIRRLRRFGDLRTVRPRELRVPLGDPRSVEGHLVIGLLRDHAALTRGRALQIGHDRLLDAAGILVGSQVGLAELEEAPAAVFDFIIAVHELASAVRPGAAIAAAHRALAPGGVLVSTWPGVVSPGWPGALWRITPSRARRMFEQVFATEAIEVRHEGNALAAVAAAYALPADELTPEELAYRDPTYPMVVGVTATKA
jgi:SAM-dependent methyltransferase